MFSNFNHFNDKLLFLKAQEYTWPCNCNFFNIIFFNIFISVIICLIHFLIYPFQISLHPDTTGSIEAAESFIEEGKLLQPFEWTYIFERKGKLTMPRDGKIINLNNDDRVGVNWYPPGYSLLIALGLAIGFTTAETASICFYACMFLSINIWLLWAVRVKIPISIIIISVCTYLKTAPATITDPFGYFFAALIMFLSTFRLTPITLLAGGIAAAIAVQFRHAAIFLPITWFFMCIYRCNSRPQLFWLIVSCIVGIFTDLLSKLLRSGSVDVMGNVWDGQFPSLVEITKASYYAVNGGWSPSSYGLKFISLFLCLATIFYLLDRYKKKQISRWEIDLVIMQVGTLIVLCGAQYKYGADFTKAPIAIARYWHYVTPGIVCLQVISFGWLMFKISRRTLFHYIPKLCCSFFFFIVVFELILENRTKLFKFKQSPDGFSRSELFESVHEQLRNIDLLATLTDSHQFTFTSVDPKKHKNIFYMEGFFSLKSGNIALVTTGSKRGEIARATCMTELTLLRDTEIFPETVHVTLFKLSANEVVYFPKTSAENELILIQNPK